ncbi:hypothetical protein D9Q98_007723 [Chlorella vulgaris]|uniref:Uncharacterized protein n=1 Tax=Chlorella vulgaris TaxID=3077 RepID=A0A9D4THB4_CHLVU|nr:hypothetical protein D9Q98_007723 [Chlorella vulgaris]
MQLPRSALLLGLVLALAATAQAGRSMLQDDPASWVDPSGRPAECTGNNNDWEGDDIECALCGGQYRLECDEDDNNNNVECEWGNPGMSRGSGMSGDDDDDDDGDADDIRNSKTFTCAVDRSKTPALQCDWAQLQGELPSCAWEEARRILATWVPLDD